MRPRLTGLTTKKMFKKASFLAPCQAGEQEPDANEVNERVGAGRQALVVLAETTLSANPRERALDHPAAWQDMEAWCVAQSRHKVRGIALQLPPVRVDDVKQRP